MKKLKKYYKVGFSIFGTIDPPPGLNQYPDLAGGGVALFLGNILKLIQVVGAIYALFNFVLAGLSYMSAGGDPKKIADASQKIYLSIIGIAVMMSVMVLAAILSSILYGDFYSMWWLPIYGP